MIRDALRTVARHREGTCEKCTEDGCPDLARARALVAVPGEW
jgi:hypothetical protein